VSSARTNTFFDPLNALVNVSDSLTVNRLVPTAGPEVLTSSEQKLLPRDAPDDTDGPSHAVPASFINQKVPVDRM
jgi:hypothetical protein